MNVATTAVALLAFCLAAAAEVPQLPTWRNPADGALYVRVPAGGLTVGSEIYSFPHGFWISRTEVTIGQFRRFARATAFLTTAERAHAQRTWRNPGHPQTTRHPVLWLTYEDALAYATWAGVDLPTEAEWLYAARAGSETKFFWGDQHDHRYMWHRENSPSGPRPVATTLPNMWGLFDMVGNAWEYTHVSTPDGTLCRASWGLLGASWTRCPRYRMRDGRVIDAIDYSLGPVRTECPKTPAVRGPIPWDDDRGFRCVRRTPVQ
jgi:formylglycine-generating enzyme required for sulfatase activity